MTPTASDFAPAETLAAVRRAQDAADTAALDLLEGAIRWCGSHEVTDEDFAATWGDSPVPLAGEGAPLISQFCVGEFAAALGRSYESGERFLAQALELSARLPRTLAQARAGKLPVWKAARIAEETIRLTAAGAEFVDAQIGPFAARVSWAQLDRLVQEAISRHCPELAREIARRSADQRDVVIDTRQISFNGTAHLTADLDLADALDLDKAVSAGAEALKALGSDLDLGPRRALALGAMARAQKELSFPANLIEGTPSRSAELVRTGPIGVVREVVLYAHVGLPSQDDPEAVAAFLDNTKSLITTEQLAAWCGDAKRVVVKPVVDLHEHLTVSGYRIPERIGEHVELRDRYCRVPFCERRAKACDKDHVHAYDPDGSADQTSTCNLACLCRRHHRFKTFGAWTYVIIEPGTYLWRSPLGYSFLVDSSGTRDLTPRPVDPPGN